jgi:hemolysin III
VPDAFGRPGLGPIRNPIRFALDLAGVSFWCFAAWQLWWAITAAPQAPLGVLVLPATQIALFAVSACYHGVPWSPVWKDRWQRADHSMIYVKIAGSVTALLLIVDRGDLGQGIAAAAWAMAAVGIAQKVWWPEVHEKASIPVQLAQACLAVPALLALGHHAPGRPLLLGLGAALAYAIGLGIFVTQRPNPWPRWFSFHDLFHVLLLGASGSLYVLFLERLGVMPLD